MDVFLDSFFNDFFGSDARCPKNKFGLKEIAFNDCPEAPRIKVPTSSDRAGTDLTRVNVGGRLYCFEKLDPEDYSYGTRWRIYRFRPGHARQFPPIFGMVQFSSGQVKPLFVLDRIKADEAGLEVLPLASVQELEASSSSEPGAACRYCFRKSQFVPYSTIHVFLEDALEAELLEIDEDPPFKCRIRKEIVLGRTGYTFKGLCQVARRDGRKAVAAKYKAASRREYDKRDCVSHGLTFWVTDKMQPMRYAPDGDQHLSFENFIGRLEADDPLLERREAEIQLDFGTALAIGRLFGFLEKVVKQAEGRSEEREEDMAAWLSREFRSELRECPWLSAGMLAEMLKGLPPGGRSRRLDRLELSGCASGGRIQFPLGRKALELTGMKGRIANGHLELGRPQNGRVQITLFQARDAEAGGGRGQRIRNGEAVRHAGEIFDLEAFDNTLPAGERKQKLVFSAGITHSIRLIFTPSGGSQQYKRGGIRHP